MTVGHKHKLTREKGSFISHVATLVTGTAISQGITFAAMLVLTRIFEPEAFGLLAIFMTIVSLFSVLGGGRYELAIMLPEDDREAANVFHAATLVLTAICIFSLLAVALFHQRLAGVLGEPLVESWLWAIPAVLFVSGFSQVLGYWCGRMKRFRHVAVSRIAQSFGTMAMQIALFLVHAHGGVALIGGWIFGQSLGVAVLLVQVIRQDGAFLRDSWDGSTIPRLLHTYKNFPFYKAPYSFVSNSSSQLVIVAIRVFSSLTTVGLFSMASRAIYLPVTLVASSMNQVFYEKAATETAPGRLESFVNRVLRIQVVLMTPLLFFAAFESKLVFATLFGARWTESGSFAAFLAFAGYMYFLTSWLDRLFDVNSRQRLALVLEIAGSLVSLIALIVTLAISGSALRAVAAFTITEVSYSLIWLFFAYRVAGFQTAALRKLGWDFLSAGVPMAGALLVIHAFIYGWWALVVSAACLLGVEAFVYLRYVRGNLAHPTAERFRTFWSDKKSPLHGSDSSEFYQSLALELKALFPSDPRAGVLEIGCGDGSLFRYLDFPANAYTGVDFSPTLLEVFRERHPDLHLCCAEGSSFYESSEQYRLIFSHGVVQHFDQEMLHRHFENARRMMGANSSLICASVLDKSRRHQYEAGLHTKGSVARLVRQGKSHLRRLLGMDIMGYWYSRDEFARIANEHGFETSFTESRVFSYRFHATLSPKAARSLRTDPSSFSRTSRSAISAQA
jgi:O-antigen/teichoic acid export membrane protein/2-polyprenyl-3-methyl-5-hydroxy-6-metoxy-1,4-benzoquinol methylase